MSSSDDDRGTQVFFFALAIFFAAIIVAILFLSSCGESAEGPRGDQGPAGPPGPQGVPGPSITIVPYIIEVVGTDQASAWCEEGDVVLGGSCSWASDVGPESSRPRVEDGFVVGWTCERGEATQETVVAIALCGVLEP